VSDDQLSDICLKVLKCDEDDAHQEVLTGGIRRGNQQSVELLKTTGAVGRRIGKPGTEVYIDKFGRSRECKTTDQWEEARDSKQKGDEDGDESDERGNEDDVSYSSDWLRADKSRSRGDERSGKTGIVSKVTSAFSRGKAMVMESMRRYRTTEEDKEKGGSNEKGRERKAEAGSRKSEWQRDHSPAGRSTRRGSESPIPVSIFTRAVIK